MSDSSTSHRGNEQSDAENQKKNLQFALQKEELTVHYQPLISLYTGRIIGSEALIRWQHPEYGSVPPVEFIPIAEESGLIIPLGEWILRTACKQNKLWLNAGFPPMKISVNFSAKQFQQHNLLETVNKTLYETGMDPEYLEIEITESIAMNNAEATISTLRKLNELGIRISIDDFGTGYSSLSYLKKFPIHNLKVDRSFVRDITSNPDDRAIVTAIITLAKVMKLNVIAEGVETMGQLDILRSLDCNEMQGYLFSRPVSPQEFTQLLMDKKRLPVGNHHRQDTVKGVATG